MVLQHAIRSATFHVSLLADRSSFPTEPTRIIIIIIHFRVLCHGKNKTVHFENSAPHHHVLKFRSQACKQFSPTKSDDGPAASYSAFFLYGLIVLDTERFREI
jgi:hypothetical protein